MAPAGNVDGWNVVVAKITRKEPPNAARSKLQRYLSISTYKGVKKDTDEEGRKDQ